MTPPIVSIIGKSNSGKTTLIEKLLRILRDRGYRVATIKHHFHQDKSLDVPGKDSYRHAQAGAERVVLVAPLTTVTYDYPPQPPIPQEIAARLTGFDLVLTEGFKKAHVPHIEVLRRERNTIPIGNPDYRLALATDFPIESSCPVFDLNDIEGVCGLIEREILHLDRRTKRFTAPQANQDRVQLTDLSLRLADRKQADQILQLIMDHIPLSIFWKDENLNYLGCNRKFAADAGLSSPDEIIGRDDYEMPWVKEADLYRADDRQVLTTGISKLYYEEPQTTPAGKQFWLRTSKIPLADASGKVVGVLGMYEDITELKRHEQERERLISELEAKNEELERFTYTVSHDLKSPLITINGFLGMLQDDLASGDIDRIQSDVNYIRNAVIKMDTLIKNLLELSRIGRQVNPAVVVEFEVVVHEALNLLAGQIAGRGVEVILKPGLPLIYGDRSRLVEVVQNLVDNAIKFMGDQPQPRIEIGARQEAKNVVCYVRDNGIGIASDDHDRLFNLFVHLDPTIEGTGIGLTLAKRIVELNGGRIWIESPGEREGSTFFFNLPAPPEV
jgi:molybdopterin-guanine dinucleotide biosynthesis protein MobB